MILRLPFIIILSFNHLIFIFKNTKNISFLLHNSEKKTYLDDHKSPWDQYFLTTIKLCTCDDITCVKRIKQKQRQTHIQKHRDKNKIETTNKHKHRHKYKYKQQKNNKHKHEELVTPKVYN